MERNAKFIVSLTLVIFGISIIGGYAYVRSRNFLRGPQITITNPADGSTFTEPEIILTGNAQNISSISLNDAPIFVDPKGNFGQKLLLQTGYNILTVRAQDRFGKKAEKALELVYKGKETVVATSSPTLATSTVIKE